MDKETAKKLIKESLVKAIQRAGKTAFELSQSKCPVDTGELKRSGSVKDLENGIEIDYTADYASIVEQGSRAGNINVPSHKRSGKTVRAYSYYSKGQQPTKFLENSITEVFNNFSQEFENNLKTVVKVEK